MKVLLVSDVDSPHTQQWAIGLANRGIEIGIFSLRDHLQDWTKAYPLIRVLYARHPVYYPWLGLLNNFNLFTYNQALRKAIRTYQPDIIHGHNLGNHGLIAARAGCHPLILSAWGSDIFEHPHKSFLHRYWTRYTLRQADRVLATSKALAAETEKYCTKTISTTPFGIDCQHFTPSRSKKNSITNSLTIGSVKRMEKVYNHQQTLKGFAELLARQNNTNLQLLMVGQGTQLKALKSLAEELGIRKQVTFTGLIPYAEIPDYLVKIDIFVNISKRESFGVAILEASAMQIPVIASNVEGIPEVVNDQKSGFLIDPHDTEQLVDALEKLVLDKNLRETMGRNGRAFVLKNYEKQKCLEQMIHIYEETLKSK